MDFVTMNILESTMVSICREMGIVLMKTSYSTIFNEALDFTCGIADMNGDMIAVADYCPAQIGGMPLLVQSCLKEISASEMEDGDIIVHNDPYRGGLHTPEHTFFKPIFVDNEIMGFAVAIGHIAEVGGTAPGGFCGEATEIFHEGLRIPPVKIKKRGQDNVEVWKLLLANVRTPRSNYGDLRALIAAVDLGEKQMIGVYKKYGKHKVKETVNDLLLYSERRMRAELEAIPDGIYSFADYVESDGIVADRTYTIAVEVHKTGGNIVVDYTGSSPQAAGPINATLGVSTSAAYNAVLHMTDPSIPRNSGCFRPIRVVAPPGTWISPHPKSVEIPKRTRGWWARFWAPCPRPCQTASWRPRAPHTAILCSGALTHSAVNILPATTWRALAGAGAPSQTATTRWTRSTATAALRPRRSMRRVSPGVLRALHSTSTRVGQANTVAALAIPSKCSVSTRKLPVLR